MNKSLFLVISLIVATSLCDTISQTFLKTAVNLQEGVSLKSVKKVILFIFRLAKIKWVWAGLFFSILSLCIWLVVLSKADLNYAFSVDSMHYIFIAFSSKLILKEKVGTLRILGTLFIVIGITLVSLG